MPTYQYQCTECGEPLEVQQSFSEPSLTECPSCSGRLRKVYNAVGVVFKGSGFYRNDSRGSDPSGSSTDTSGEKSSSDKAGSDSGKSDTGSTGDSGGSTKKTSETSTSSSASKSKATTPA